MLYPKARNSGCHYLLGLQGVARREHEGRDSSVEWAIRQRLRPLLYGSSQYQANPQGPRKTSVLTLLASLRTHASDPH